jgi:hypothetical protein
MKRASVLIGLVTLLGGNGPVATGDSPASTTGAARTPIQFSGNAYDFALLVSSARQFDLAIDPAVMATLGRTRVEMRAPSDAEAPVLLAVELGPHGLVLQPTQLAADRPVALLSSPAAWAHLTASEAIRRGDFKRAYDALVSVEKDTSDLGKHCARLRQSFLEIQRRNQQIADLERQVRVSLDEFRRAAQDMETARMAYQTRGQRGSEASDPVLTFASNRYNKAVAEARKTFEAMDRLYERLTESNKLIAEALDEAQTRGFSTEAHFLFENLYTSFVRFRSLLGAMQKEELLEAQVNLEKMPEFVEQVRASLKTAVDTAAAHTRAAQQALRAGDTPRAGQLFMQAHATDAGLALARIGRGYCAVQANLQSLRELLEPPAPLETRRQTIEREFRDRRKLGFQQVLAEIRTRETATAAPAVRTRLGSATGLAVTDGKGALFPVAVRIENVPSRGRSDAAQPGRSGYWSSALLKELEDKDFPVSFGDYGMKDPFMLMGAVEAYKWLKSLDRALSGRVGFSIDFHELFGGKAGDSAGVAVAASAYSSLRQVPLRQDVAITGSIRANGDVKAVGAVPLKIAGALASDDVEIAIVPRENEADLLWIPFDELCKLVIVVADDISTYLKYITSPDAAKQSEEQKQALARVRQLQAAQMHLLLGDRAAAAELLAPLTAAGRELYNVERLLGVLRIHASLQGDHDTLARLNQLIEQAGARHALAGVARDFRIEAAHTSLPAELRDARPKPRTTDADAAPSRADPPARTPEASVRPPAPIAPATARGQIRIRAYVDHRSVLKLQRNRLWWEHSGGGYRPGEQKSVNEPTYVNGLAWRPEWDGNISRPYLIASSGLPSASGLQVSVVVHAGRGEVKVEAQPSPSNSYTAAILVSDPQAFADWYEFDIRW